MAERPDPMARPVIGRGKRPGLRPDSVAMIALVTVLTAYGALSSNMLLPALPALAGDLKVSAGHALLTITAFFIGFGSGQLIYGSLSDRAGRRPILIGGLVLYLAATTACFLAPTIDTLMAARVFQGIAAAAGQVLARAVVRDLFAPAEAARMLSYSAAAFTLASGLSPLVGALIQSALGWRAIFAVQGGIGFLTLAAVWWFLAESLARRDPSALSPLALATNYLGLLGSRTFIGYSLLVALVFAATFSFHTGSSFVLIEILGFSPRGYALLFAMVISGYFFGSLTSARITMRVGFRRLAMAGGLLCAVAGLTMLSFVLTGMVNAWTICVPQFFFMVGLGFLFSNALAGAMAPFPHKAGAASALMGFIQQMAGGAMVALLAALADGTALPMAACIFGGAVTALIAARVLIPRSSH